MREIPTKTGGWIIPYLYIICLLSSIKTRIHKVDGFSLPPPQNHNKKNTFFQKVQRYEVQKFSPFLYLSSPASSNEDNNNSDNNDDDDNKAYDLAILGAGPVGVKAALLASTVYKKKVVLIDAPRASGVLMNEETKQDLSIGGPTGLFSKALRDSSKRIRVDSLRGMGLREDSIWNEIINSCVDLASWNSDDVYRQLNFAGVDYVEGFASFPNSDDNEGEGEGDESNIRGTKELLITSEQKSQPYLLKSENVLIATGSRPFRPSGIPFDGERIFDSDSINQLSYLPSSIAITGSGIIAIEFAKIFRNLGADVTLIIRDNIPRNALMKIGLDIDIAACLVADLVRSGIKIERGAQVADFDVPPSNVNLRAPIKVSLEAKGGGKRPQGCTEEIRCDAYLAAVGRIPNTAKLNLSSAGIQVDEYDGLVVNSDLCTTAPDGNVYGAGDVLGRPFLASTGVAQALAAVQAIFDDKPKNSCVDEFDQAVSQDENELCIDGDLSLTGDKFDPKSLASNPFAFPTGVWSSPEAAYYGLSKQQCKELGIDAGEGIALYSECLRGLVFNPNGLLKLVYNKENGRILGIHICGDDACELIHYGMELVKSRRTISDLVDSLYSAVTYHEMYRIAAVAAIDEAGARKRRAAAGSALAARNRATKKSQR